MHPKPLCAAVIAIALTAPALAAGQTAEAAMRELDVDDLIVTPLNMTAGKLEDADLITR
jgi:hypothetical protein